MIKTFCENVSRKLFILVAGVLALLGSLCSLVSVRAAGTETAPGNFQVTIAEVPVLKIVLSSATASMTVTPSQGGAGFNTADLAVTVGTSSTAGYTLKMATSNNGALISGGNSMPTLDGATDTSGNNYTCTIATATNCNFTTNSWGFRLSTDTANTFKGAPVESTEIVSYTDGATNGEVTNLQFGARVDANLPAGAYGTTVNFTAVANAELPDINDISTMQDFAALNSDELQAVVDSMEAGASYELSDSRDDNTYNIAKLADGNVWLQDNLQLDIAANRANITSATTNAEDDALTCLKSGCSSSTTYSQVAAANTSASNWSGATRYTTAMYNTEYANYDASYGDGTHKSGYYYNFCAASAGSYCYSSSSGTGNASQDICPAGWQMPAGDSSTYSYQKLYEAYGSDYAALKNALHVGLSGHFYGGVYNQGGSGRFWASTYRDTDSMRFLYVDASSVNPQGSDGRFYGFSVRCVLKSSGLDTSITFNPNGADSGSATTLTLTSGSTALPTSGSLDFSKNGYVGVSWNTAPDGSGTTYAAGAQVTAGMNGLTLYAQWSAGSWMQGLAYNSCTTTAQTVYDVRDGNSYTVQRLADGKCWLMDNLSFDLVNVPPTDLQGNTNASNETLAKLKNGGGASDDQYTTAAVVETSSFGLSGDAYTAAKINSSYNGKDKNTEWLYDGTNKGKQGIYYNYCAASAGSYCYTSGNPSSDPDTTTLIDAKEDICPAGWRMPTSGASGEYQNLCTTAWGSACSNGMDMSYSNAKSIQSVLHAPLSGYFSNNSTSGQGNSGLFWSSTYGNDGKMYALFVQKSKSWTQSSNYRYNGFPVRCVLKATQ
ncbi:hypothetical protein IKE83_02390 [Candidatus Saccharibacteria bacterium]|nr:hypothetical protein [Candidatus Saccharibacteria bacterium]